MSSSQIYLQTFTVTTSSTFDLEAQLSTGDLVQDAVVSVWSASDFEVSLTVEVISGTITSTTTTTYSGSGGDTVIVSGISSTLDYATQANYKHTLTISNPALLAVEALVIVRGVRETLLSSPNYIDLTFDSP